MKLYENIIIVNFLFDLGVRMAKLRPDLPLISVNLLQQTPLDKPLSDVLLGNAAVCRLIEFMRAGKLTPKERKKFDVLRSGIEGSDSEKEYLELSRQVHWYIESGDPLKPGETIVTRACPYLDASGNQNFISVHQFAKATAEEACLQEPNLGLRNLRDRYINWVCALFTEIEAEEREAKHAQGKRSASSGTFAVAINNKGETYWLAVPSIEYTLMHERELHMLLVVKWNTRQFVSNSDSNAATDRVLAYSLSIPNSKTTAP